MTVTDPAAHPEELRATASASFGSSRVEAAARCTPAGLIAVGIMVSCILLSVAAVIRAARARPENDLPRRG